MLQWHHTAYPNNAREAVPKRMQHLFGKKLPLPHKSSACGIMVRLTPAHWKTRQGPRLVATGFECSRRLMARPLGAAPPAPCCLLLVCISARPKVLPLHAPPKALMTDSLSHTPEGTPSMLYGATSATCSCCTCAFYRPRWSCVHLSGARSFATGHACGADKHRGRTVGSRKGQRGALAWEAAPSLGAACCFRGPAHWWGTGL
jgi:hypothetical protein